MAGKFNSLSQREQLSIVICLLLVLASVLVFGVWRPVNKVLYARRIEYTQVYAANNQVKAYVDNIQALQNDDPESGEPGTESLTGLVNDGLLARQLQLTRMQQASPDQVQVRLDGVELGAVLGWLYELENTPGLIVRELSMNPANGAQGGLVNVSVSLSRFN